MTGRKIDFDNHRFDQCGSVHAARRWDRLGIEMEHQMAEHGRVHDADGMAALGICESLLIALTDLKIIGEKDARDLLADVATTHNEAAAVSQTPEKHQAVVEIVQRILAGKNGLRH